MQSASDAYLKKVITTFYEIKRGVCYVKTKREEIRCVHFWFIFINFILISEIRVMT